MPRPGKTTKAVKSILRKPTPTNRFPGDNKTGKAQKGKITHVKWDLNTTDNEFTSKPMAKDLIGATFPSQHQKSSTSKQKSINPYAIMLNKGGPAKKSDSTTRLQQDPQPRSSTSTTTKEPGRTGSSSRIEQKSRPENKKETHLEVSQARDRGNRQQSGPSTGRASTTATAQHPDAGPVPRTGFEKLQGLFTAGRAPKRPQEQHKRTYMNMNLVDPIEDATSQASRNLANRSLKRNSWIPTQYELEQRRWGPPAVPDPPMPSWSRTPPPAPRPGRLPTPELPDIDGHYFEDLTPGYGTMARQAGWESDRYEYEDKMNYQLQNALDHIQGSRASRK